MSKLSMIELADKQTRLFIYQSHRLLWRTRRATLKHALRAMFHLNHVAYGHGRHSSRQRQIYALKSAFIECLYKKGLVSQVTQQTQNQYCWRCGGTGAYDPYDPEYGECFKCDGTGIYRRHTLIKFVIEHGRRRYVWHQPAALCEGYLDVAFIPQDEQPSFANPNDSGMSIPHRVSEWRYYVVCSWLNRQGVSISPFLLFSWKQFMSVRAPRWWRRLKYDIQERLRSYETSDMSDIPF